MLYLAEFYLPGSAALAEVAAQARAGADRALHGGADVGDRLA